MESTELLKILDKFEELSKKIESLNSLPSITNPYESAEIKNLATALSKAQGEYPIIGLNRDNPYFKSNYADLDSILRAIRPSLSKYGLAFTQQTKINDDGATMLHSRLWHSTGEWIESRNRILPLKNDPQTYGSTLTYQKRYAAIALLGVTCSFDHEDDDGEVAMVEVRHTMAKGVALNTKYNPKEASYEPITKEQLEELEYELSEYPDIAEDIIDKMKIQSLADLPKSKFLLSVNRIREIKQLRNGK